MTTTTATAVLTIYIPPGGEVPEHCVCGRKIPEAARKLISTALAAGKVREHSACKTIFSAVAAPEPEPTFTTAPPPRASRRDRKRLGREGAEEGKKRARAHVDPKFWEEALVVVETIARRQQMLTSDPVWDEIDRLGITGPHEPRVMGAIMEEAARRGWIELPTPEIAVKSIRPERHRGWVGVWKSMIYAPTPPAPTA